jgi:ribonuclease Z
MIECTVLGSAGTKPTKDRNTAAYYCRCEGISFLLDAGENVQQSLLKHCTEFETDFIVISHKHGDHYFGLIPYLVTMHLLNRVKPLNLYLPSDMKFFESMMSLQGIKLCYELNIVYYSEKTEIKYSKFMISFFKTNHTVNCYGFKLSVFERYTLDEAKLHLVSNKKNLSILQKGIAVFEGETLITPQEVCKTNIPRFTIVYGADSRPINHTELFGCKLLIHEGTFEDDELHLAKLKKHSCVSEAKLLAPLVDTLCISHIGSKIRPKKDEGNIFFAKDGLSFVVSNTGVVSCESQHNNSAVRGRI